MDYVQHALNAAQRAPLTLLVALAVSTVVGAALLVSVMSWSFGGRFLTSDSPTSPCSSSPPYHVPP